MDSVSQAALGAAIGEIMLGKKIGNRGAFLGGIIATIPDLDILLTPLYSDLTRLTIHRGLSHSVLFSFLGGLLFAYVLSRIKWTNSISFAKLLVFSWLTLITHMILDTFTSYGTQLWLPFSDHRASLDAINIVDPLYTVPLLIGLIFSLWIKRHKNDRSFYSWIALGASSFYLMSTLGTKLIMSDRFTTFLEEQHVSYNELLTVPVGIASLKWYGVAKSKDSLFISYKYLFKKGEGSSLESFPINEHLLADINPQLQSTLKWFSKDFYAVTEYDGKVRLYNMQCDMQGVRYFGDNKAPTAFYFEMDPVISTKEFTVGMHPKESQ